MLIRQVLQYQCIYHLYCETKSSGLSAGPKIMSYNGLILGRRVSLVQSTKDVFLENMYDSFKKGKCVSRKKSDNC